MPSEKQVINISSNNKDKVVSYFKEAMDLYTSDFKLENFNIIKNIEIIYILGGMININGEPICSELTRNVINEGIKKIKKDNIINIDDIIKSLNKIYYEIKNKPISKYRIVASLHLDKKCLPQLKGKFLNVPFSIYNSKSFFRKYKIMGYINPPFEKVRSGMKNFIIFSKEEIDNLTKSNYIEITLDSKDQNIAYNEGWNIIEIFRSIINYSYCIGQYRIVGETNPYSILLPSAYIFVFDENNNFLIYGFTKSFYERNIKEIELEHISKLKHNFNNILKIIEKIKNNEIKNVLISSFLRHGKGLDELAYGTSFICFWQTLELISLKIFFNFSEKDVCNRIKSILLKEKLKDKIDVLYSRRNYLMHEGKISDYDLMDANNIKEVSELSIMFILNNIKNFSDMHELDLFYKYVNENNVSIKRINKILQYIKKQRKR